MIVAVLLSSCAAKKELAEVKIEKDKLLAELNQCTNDLAAANTRITTCDTKVATLEYNNQSLKGQVDYLKSSNAVLMNNVGDLATLSTKEAENLERSLESIKEKDMQIKTMRDAINKKDSVTLALVTSLKSALGNINDEDIEINVEKGAVFVSISDKLLFKSGSYVVNDDAKRVLKKVAMVLNDKDDIEFMVEGHTDNVPINTACIKDNWDLSVMRATSVVRILQGEYKVDPDRITAGGRSYFTPVADNDSSADRAKNRRTRIVILPKLDQFFGMIEEGMKEATGEAP